MADTLEPDICVIGAGSAGLALAAGASQMGARVVLIESHRMGGECLNTGCVPSKALLAAARALRGADRSQGVDFARVYDRVHGVIAELAPQDSAARFEGLGVRVLRARARFVGSRELIAGARRIRARRFVVATGSRALVPPIPGIERVSYYTNESLFDARIAPTHLIVVGAGPIGVELAQAYRRLGVRVSLLEAVRILPADDPELTAIVAQRLIAEGVELREGAAVTGVEPAGDGVAVTLEGAGGSARIVGSHLLLAVGRRAALEGLGLEAAGVGVGPEGVVVDSRLRTANRRIFAIGDAAGPYRFTHMAAYQAGIVIRNALFRLPAKVDYRAVPWVTFTDPELAHVGMSLEQARARRGGVRILRWPFDENDRAAAEGRPDGLVKAVVTAKGRILGASIVGAEAGELIQLWALAIARRLGVGALANLVLPYPTLGEASKRAAGSFYAPALFGARTKALVRFLAGFG